MSKSAAQRTTGNTRIKGPTVITLYGAGSKGKEGTLGGVAPVGTGFDVGLSVQIPTGQSANSFQVEKPDGTVIAAFDSSGNLIQSGVLSIVSACVQKTLTAAQIISLHSAPVALVAAPGATKALIVSGFVFQFKYGSVQMTGGGVVNPVYHSATTSLTAGGVAAATIQAAANYTGYSPGAAGATALAVTTNAGVDLYAATADFAAGDSTAIVTLFYDILTLG